MYAHQPPNHIASSNSLIDVSLSLAAYLDQSD
jgi:hypothetical protein